MTAYAAASLSLTPLSTLKPESVAITSPATGEQLVGYFSGWTKSFKLAGQQAKESTRVSGLVPLTVFTAQNETITCGWMRNQVELYKSYDDVFEDFFMKAVYLQGGFSYAANVSSCLSKEYGTDVLFAATANLTSAAIHSDTIPNGPFLAQIANGEVTLGPVYRVFPDDHMAFMNGILPNGTEGVFRYASVNSFSDSTIGIPVPSRLYTKDSAVKSKPLQGLRVTVKDIIDINGIKTSNGNRAWFKLYDAKNATAPAIQRLVDMGAVLIGKTKTAQFANSDRPTADWVDYHDAFNPRGDGYQDPGVSSAGSGAATAAYDWVDVSIGTDTGGSIRIPAAKNGVFGLRPSFGALSNVGVMPEGEHFDAVGYHTRSPYLLREFGKAWLAESKQLVTNHTSFPHKLIVPGNLWPVANNASQVVFDQWITKLATFLNATIETKAIGDYWNETAHEDKPGTEFFEYMQMVGFHLIWKYQLEKVITPFRNAYAAVFGGRLPYINPFPAARYMTAVNTTEEDVKTSYERFTFFKDWFGKNVVKSDRNACSESLFLIPMSASDVSYRNTVYSPVNVSSWATFTPYYYSVQSQGPEIVLPIGEAPYLSNITGVEEKLPIAIDLLAHRNCDLMLLDLAEAMADAGLVKAVKTGSTLW